VQGGAISELAGWHDVKTIETDGAWQIDDIHKGCRGDPAAGRTSPPDRH
jgi:hypothetical protein